MSLDEIGQPCLTSNMAELVTIADNIFALQDSLRLLPGFYLPIRTTVIRLASGELVLISPLAIDDALAEQLAQLGPVTHLIGPNCLHHLFMAKAQARYPAAKTWLSPGLSRKLPNLAHDHLLPDQLPSELQAIEIRGAAKLSEFAIWHEPSKSLVVTDLVFNILSPRGWLTPMILRTFGTHQRLAQSRALRFMTDDRALARESVKQMLALDFSRLIMAHGEVVENDAKAGLSQALGWMLAGA